MPTRLHDFQPAPERAPEIDRSPAPDWAYDDIDDECANCGGEGVVYDCIDGCCVNAEDGCDLCARRCDWCNPTPRREPTDG